MSHAGVYCTSIITGGVIAVVTKDSCRYITGSPGCDTDL